MSKTKLKCVSSQPTDPETLDNTIELPQPTQKKTDVTHIWPQRLENSRNYRCELIIPDMTEEIRQILIRTIEAYIQMQARETTGGISQILEYFRHNKFIRCQDITILRLICKSVLNNYRMKVIATDKSETAPEDKSILNEDYRARIRDINKVYNIL
jgi:hypothetical protein